MIQNRLERVRARMRAHGVEQLIVTQPQAIYYLTGLWCNPMDRLDALVVTQERCKMLCYVLAVIEPEGCEVTVYSDSGAAVSNLSGLLENVETGVDGTLQGRFLLPLMQLRPELRLRISSCVEEARTIKTDDEILLLRRASEVTDDVFASAFAQLREGMTELELGAVFSDSFMAHGVGRFAGDPMVCFGAGSAEPHHTPGNVALKPGDAVCVDTGKRIDGYYSDMTRTVFFREVSPLQREVYDIVLEANLAALNSVRPGVLMSDIHEAACKVIRDAGYGDYYPHRTSHGIGIDYHEEPFDVAGRPVVMEPGMCISVEPGIYLPGRFGVRIEDLVVITEDGCSLLNHAPKELTVIG